MPENLTEQDIRTWLEVSIRELHYPQAASDVTNQVRLQQFLQESSDLLGSIQAAIQEKSPLGMGDRSRALNEILSQFSRYGCEIRLHTKEGSDPHKKVELVCDEETGTWYLSVHESYSVAASADVLRQYTREFGRLSLLRQKGLRDCNLETMDLGSLGMRDANDQLSQVFIQFLATHPHPVNKIPRQ